MGQTPLPASRRRFGGARAPGADRGDGMAAVAEMLFSSCGGTSATVTPAAVAPGPPAPVSAAIASLSACPAPRGLDDAVPLSAAIDPPQGLYLMVPAGIDVGARRRTALAVAASLVPRGGRAAVFLLEGGAADAHVFGEVACGRLGPEHWLDATDAGRAIHELLSQCDQVAIVPLEAAGGLPRGLAARARRTVFVAATDAESVVETYRELKAWRARGLALPASLFVVGTDGAAEAGRLVGRLRRASREFLGCDLANQGFLASGAATFAAEHPEPLRILSHAPVGEIWPRLLGDDAELQAAGGADRTAEIAPAARPPLGEVRPTAAEIIAVRPGPCCEPAVAPVSQGCSVFAAWRPEGREDLMAAIEAQPPEALGKSLRRVIRADVDEAAAPALAAVRDDGALVAILIAQNGLPVDTQAAARWLTAHRRLLARAYPHAGIREGAEPSAIVLAPLAASPADGIRRFLPLQLGGHRGIVLLP